MAHARGVHARPEEEVNSPPDRLHGYLLRQYFDIPLRGILFAEGKRLPFLAEVDQRTADKSWVKGIPTKMRLFEAVPSLENDFELIDRKFKQWRLEGARTEHPLLTDPRYNEAMRRIDEYFDKFAASSTFVSGLFSNDGESWNFEPVSLE